MSRISWAGFVAGTAALATALAVVVSSNSDLAPPTVAITAPAAGTVSGTIAFSATASDNVAVAGVQFKLDGANLQAEDTSDPYSISWDTTTTTDGSHTLTATARDTSNNTTTSSSVAVTVSNGGGGPITANLWVDTSGGSCADSASLIAYPNNGTECGSLNAAYVQAEAGDVVGIKGGAGTYSGETVNYRSALDGLTPGCDPYGEWGAASTANCVRVVPEGTVTFTSSLVLSGSNIWLNGTATGSWSNPWARTYNIVLNDAEGEGTVYASAASQTQDADHIIVEGVDAGTFQAEADFVHFRDYNAGPSNRDPGPTCSEPESKVIGSSWGKNANITLERVFIHGQTTSDAANCHTGGFITFGISGNFDMRQIAVTDNAVYGILFDSFGGQTDGVTIENSWFGCVNQGNGGVANLGTCDAGKPALSFKNVAYSNYVIRYNSSRSNIILDSGGTFPNGYFIGNVFRPPLSSDPFCGSNQLTKDYNVWVGTSSNLCGGTNGAAVLDMTTIFTNVAVGTEDFRLLNTTNVANDFVVPTTSPYNLAVDAEGDSRPLDTNRDAGLDERNTP